MTRKQAITKLRETRKLSTVMLKPLGIPFEAFLRLGQVSAVLHERCIDLLLRHEVDIGPTGIRPCDWPS